MRTAVQQLMDVHSSVILSETVECERCRCPVMHVHEIDGDVIEVCAACGRVQ